ncbi:leucine-rich repeat-containing protein [Novymonas esmeraldas]|uniref:Leucine-rich repeat-containing protein n=1 Tax=Novymonas esmeraldas TaxID=1808958 RepID=A0AAW0F7J4_9TRYP
MEEDARLVATAPYNVEELQAEFDGVSPRDAYAALCHRSRCAPLASIAAMLPETVGAWDAVSVLDFSRTYIGSQGALPMIDLCRRLPQLRSLLLRDNYLSNDTVWSLVQMAVFHPSLERVDLSANQYVSWSGAMCLVELVLRNPRITDVGLRGTTVSEEIVAAIAAQTRQNAVSRFRAAELKASPPVHPAAVYIRALTHLFATHQQHGRVSVSLLHSGVEELLRVSGRTSELQLVTDKDLAKLTARATSGVIGCEEFLVLLLIDGSTYDADTVARLRQAFVLFNMDPSAPDPVRNGYILGRDLSAIMTHVDGAPPSEADVVAMQRRLGATADTATLGWEEFLYVAYPHGPQAGDRLCSATCTPLVSGVEVMHY